jgi:hypothetical protein
MKPSLALLAIALLGLSACADTHRTAVSTLKTTSSTPTSADGPTTTVTTATGLTTYDSDDAPLRFYGHAASEPERQAITAVVRRYYALAARMDGAGACQLIHSLIAETIVEGYGSLPASRGKTCAAVMSKIFGHRRQQLRLDSATLAVVSIRVQGVTGLVLLRFAKAAEPNHIQVRREGTVWKIWNLLANRMP